jgi:hypothetical protein
MRRRRATAWLWEKGSKTIRSPGIQHLHKAHGTVEGSELVRGTVEYQSGSNHFLQLVSGMDGRLVVSQIHRREAVSQLGQVGVTGRVECYPCPSRLRKAGTGQSKKLVASFSPSTVRIGVLGCEVAAPEGGHGCGVLWSAGWLLDVGLTCWTWMSLKWLGGSLGGKKSNRG